MSYFNFHPKQNGLWKRTSRQSNGYKNGQDIIEAAKEGGKINLKIEIRIIITCFEHKSDYVNFLFFCAVLMVFWWKAKIWGERKIDERKGYAKKILLKAIKLEYSYCILSLFVIIWTFCDFYYFSTFFFNRFLVQNVSIFIFMGFQRNLRNFSHRNQNQ